MGVEKNFNSLNINQATDIYRPPALRRSTTENSERRSTGATSPTAVQNNSIGDCISSTPERSAAEEIVTESPDSAVRTQRSAVRRERRPDRAVYVPRARRSQTTPPITTTTPESTTSSSTEQQQTERPSRRSKDHSVKHKSKTNSETKPSPDKTDKSPKVGKITQNSQATIVADSTNSTKVNMSSPSSPPPPPTLNETNNSPVLRIEDAGGVTAAMKRDDDAHELQRASKEINRSNRRIIKQTFNSDILEIPDVALSTTTTRNRTDSTKDNSINSEKDDSEDDWDSMYDENGECLDPKIIQELTASVGRVKIQTPKMDYTAYHIKQSLLNDEEYPHVLEVSNFPGEFKTQDLMMIFSSYKESGFDIKWVDDTHALAVFSSSRIAAEVLSMGHPFVLLKPLAEATLESRLKAKKCAASLLPYRQRPETCAALARRLVTGALGVRLKTAAEERENEKRVLREAKERKLLAAKQRDEAWES